MEQKSLKVNFLLNLIRTFCGIAFPVLTFAYASRILSVEGIGKFDYSRSIVSYFVLLANLGVATYGVREGAKVRNDKQKLSNLVGEILVINFSSTFIAYMLFLFFIFYVPNFKCYQLLLLINGVTIGFSALGIEWLYGALEEYKYITLRSILFQIVSFILLIVFVRTKEDIYIYAAISIFSTVGSNALNFINARKYICKPKIKFNSVKKHFTSIMIFFATSLAGTLYLSIDITMLGLLCGDYSVGLYSAASKLNRICISLVTSLCPILLPRLAFYIQDDQSNEYQRLLKKAFEGVLILSIPIAIGLFFLGDEILVLFSGKDFLPASFSAKVMSLIMILVPISTTIGLQILIPFGREKIQLYATLVGTLSNVIINMVLIPRYQHVGAAIATVISEFIVVIIGFIFASRYVQLNNIFKDIWHYTVSATGMFVGLLLVSNITSGLVKCMVSIILGSLSYFLGLYILKDDLFLTVTYTFYNKFLKKIK